MNQFNNKEAIKSNESNEDKTALVHGAINTFYETIAREKNNGQSLVDAANAYVQNKNDQMAKLSFQNAILTARASLQSITNTEELIISTNFLAQLEKNLLEKVV